MPDSSPPVVRPPSEAEAAAFHALGLTPGHWAALAPVPLLPTMHADFESFRALANLVPGTGHPDEAGGFWSRFLGSRSPGEALALLGWHLAHDVTRDQRERYLDALDHAARRVQPDDPVAPARVVREAVETALGHREYAPNLLPGRVEPPADAEVVRFLGGDLWKQMLAAPLAAVMTERRADRYATQQLLDRLSGVSEFGMRVPPDALREHLTPPWGGLFAGLLDPGTAAPPNLDAALGIAARGLASLPFAERHRLFDAIHEWVKRAVYSGDPESVARQSVDRLRTLTEEVLFGPAPPLAVPLSPPAPEAVTPLLPPPEAEPAPSPEFTPAMPPPVELAPTAPIPPPAWAPPRQVGVMTEVPAGFTTVPFDQAMTQARAVSVPSIRDWLADPGNAGRLLFDDCRGECSEVAVVRDPAAVPKSLWVVGDLHADVLTLANIIAHAERVAAVEGEPPAFLFLGDFVDRGIHDHETLLLLFGLILKDPGRVCVVPGNHDVDLRWGDKSGKFLVSIEPAEYCERLNRNLGSDDPADREQVELARLLIEFCKGRPKAVFLPDGTMFAHGGFPHTDRHARFKELGSPRVLGERESLDDFLWARLAESQKKRPNRGNRGHEFGWRDFAQFCGVMTEYVGVAVRRLVRGHDHIPARWHFCPDYADAPVLTINAMGRRLDSEPEPADGPHPFPVVGRHTPGQLPRVVRLPLDAAEVERAFAREKRPAAEPVPTDSLMNDVLGGVRLDPPGEPGGV